MPSLRVAYLCAPAMLRRSGIVVTMPRVSPADVPQRSDEWFSLRRGKLTASAFSTALGFWGAKRRCELWREKAFELLTIPSAAAADVDAKAAMDWGTLQEPRAIARYKEITGRDVGQLGFMVHAETRFSWLGASPDGVLGGYPEGGILEVKCPYNRGKPEQAAPWWSMPYYYMPQVQGLMEIMDRDWADLYCWTLNGSSIFRVRRNRDYWRLACKVLHDFWLGNVVPAQEAMALGQQSDAEAFQPAGTHELTGQVIEQSKQLAREAQLVYLDAGGQAELNLLATAPEL